MEVPKTGIAVDASMRGGVHGAGTGVVVWQGVDIATKEVLFRSDTYPEGNINLAELAALLDGIKWVMDHEPEVPLYSDSVTAIAWLSNRAFSSPKVVSEAMMPFMQRIWSDMGWLENEEVYSVASRIVRLWDTKAFGENPADLGFKKYQRVRLYAVTKGRQVGIFKTWKECAAQVVGYPGAKFEEFFNPNDAQNHLIKHQSLNQQKMESTVNKGLPTAEELQARRASGNVYANMKLGEPQLYCTVGRIGRDTMEWIEQHCMAPASERGHHPISAYDVASMPNHESPYVMEEIQDILRYAQDHEVEWLVFQDM